MTLNELSIGTWGRVTHVGGNGAHRQHFLDMGIIPGTEVRMVRHAPMGDPLEIMLHSYALSLRRADAEQIEISPLDEPRKEEQPVIDTNDLKNIEHPGLGEEGRYHSKEDEHPLPKETLLDFALVGQQNCGKTTLFNLLTGSNQHVGNFPGVTIDRKDGVIKGHPNTRITDLPGIYSLSTYTAEEVVTRRFILENRPHCIINIVDAGNIERHLYLTMQLMELDIPMVLALNMMDELRNNGGTVLVNKMEHTLGIPVLPISAAKGEGIKELVEHAIHIAQEKPLYQDFCDKYQHGGSVHRCLHSLRHLVEDHAEQAGLPIRFVADKIAEGDKTVIDALKLDDNEKQTIEHIVCQMEEERGLDRSAAIADMRFNYIEQLCRRSVVKPRESIQL